MIERIRDLTALLLHLCLAATIAITAGCEVKHKVVTNGALVHQKLGVLRSEGRARIEAKEGDTPVHRDVTLQTQVRVNGKMLSLAKLSLGCPLVPRFDVDGVPLEKCGLTRNRYRPLHLGTTTRYSVGEFVQGAVGFTSTIGLIASTACGLGCESGSTHRRVAAYSIVGFAVGLVGYLIIRCSGKWGSRGCRD